MRKFALLVASTLMLVAAALSVHILPATAVSDYDNVVQQGAPSVTCDDHEVDLSTEYVDIITAQNNAYFNEVFSDALNVGKGWVLTQGVYPGLAPNNLSLFVSGQPVTATARFYTHPSIGGYVAGQQLMRATINCNVVNGQDVFSVDFNTTTATRDFAYQDSVGGGYRPVFINMPVTYPDGYEGLVVPSSYDPPIEYVAMGDSFSSGEGNPAFEPGTDLDAVNECHRSPEAYPRLLEDVLNLSATAFVACSGATAEQASNGKWNESPQINSLSSHTEVVTLTIGGNDIKFGQFAEACLYASCASTSAAYQESWEIMTDFINNDDYLPAKLDSLFSEMVFNLYLNTSVDVYVVGYPHIITEDSWGDRGLGICSDFDLAEAQAAEALVNKLNDDVETAVADFNDSRFEFIDPTLTGSPFLGKELCRTETYFNGTESVLPPNGQNEYAFHPNGEGQQAYADLIEAHLN